MLQILKSRLYETWFDALRDRAAKGRIRARLDRLELGNPGQHRVLTNGVIEMKIDFGPGYRVYYVQRGTLLILLLCGGDKSSQQADIETALTMATTLEQ